MKAFFDLKFQEKRLLSNIDSFSKFEKKKAIEAYKLAKKYHSGQKRSEGGPYVLHCLRVTNCLIEELGTDDVNIICAALLHDTVEDTELNLSEIKRRLGEKTSQLVDSLTRKKLPDETELNKYQRKYQNFFEAMNKGFDTRAIKACDWLDAITSWPKVPKSHPSRKKFNRWLKEARTMYLPMAKSVSPKMFKIMTKALRETKKELGK